MPKILHDTDSLKYKKQLAEFMQSINPKPSLEDIEKLKQRLLEKRSEASVAIRE
ncbi:hypothetical protein J1P26_19985 [Neobacillus sp. MM2021_6]|uniref:hypothetical protein n=1 Tax=Bacillaceae TaxID=186817 RepID=UPI00140E19ED|nr:MULTISPECIES: hypothetical protein [Bacillaceae]MBO0961989.1 hypothetical protein [Neobacillus sp. MM2021_6]NHC20315.1 hypothetical protein [Bacillus sp. MM2020_4]